MARSTTLRHWILGHHGDGSRQLRGTRRSTATHGKKMSDRDCALACAAKGAQLVLVSDGKIYKLTNHDADLRAHAGHTVKLTGALTGESIRVTKIEMAAASERPALIEHGFARGAAATGPRTPRCRCPRSRHSGESTRRAS